MDNRKDRITRIIAILERECREWVPGMANAEIESLIEENYSGLEDLVFTDGLVWISDKSGWAYTAGVNGIWCCTSNQTQ